MVIDADSHSLSVHVTAPCSAFSSSPSWVPSICTTTVRRASPWVAIDTPNDDDPETCHAGSSVVIAPSAPPNELVPENEAVA